MELSASGIPILYLPDDDNDKQRIQSLAENINRACELSGCFYIKNHQINDNSGGLIDRLFDDFRWFFDQPEAYKKLYEAASSRDRGYVPFAAQNINAFMGRFDHHQPNDPVEKMSFGHPDHVEDHRERPNRWPDGRRGLRERVEAFLIQMRRLADRLARLLAVAIQAPDPDYFYRNLHRAPHSLRVNRYPPIDTRRRRSVSSSISSSNGSTRFAEHIDMTAFTILTTDQCPGALKVSLGGEWVYADPIPGALFVNLGGVLERWTNDRWKATLHKVVWPELGSPPPDRLSIAYFVRPTDECVIECIPSCCSVPTTTSRKAKYEPIKFYDYYLQPITNLASAGGARRNDQSSNRT